MAIIYKEINGQYYLHMCVANNKAISRNIN